MKVLIFDHSPEKSDWKKALNKYKEITGVATVISSISGLSNHSSDNYICFVHTQSPNEWIDSINNSQENQYFIFIRSDGGNTEFSNILKLNANKTGQLRICSLAPSSFMNNPGIQAFMLSVLNNSPQFDLLNPAPMPYALMVYYLLKSNDLNLDIPENIKVAGLKEYREAASFFHDTCDTTIILSKAREYIVRLSES